MKTLFILLFVIKLISAKPTSIILWHGMGDTCCVSFSLGGIKIFLEKQIPGVYVNSLRIGNSNVEDFENGYFMNPNKQVDYVCQQLASDPNLKDGFNAIGFSQGSQFLRAVVQRCGHILPPIKNLITLGGQHQGVYDALVQATYWHDPLDEEAYINKSIFLADINNEIRVNKTYVENLNNLEHLVLVKFDNDTIVQPRETEWFGFYEPGQAKKVVPLNMTRLYLEDRLGLQKMEKDGKLVLLSTEGDHLRFSDTWFIETIIKPYLLN
ncbi:hypothetical protein SFRURICE_016298 [Spodoptera frugiperda]|nr:hypothetical protein SFRURICE_016298 [Spodoptera frugiperda]